MTIKVNLNADMAEGYGAYDIGNDREILRIIGSASIACGFHAGDPLVMRRTIAEASRLGVSVGAHPGFNDLWGFGVFDCISNWRPPRNRRLFWCQGNAPEAAWRIE